MLAWLDTDILISGSVIAEARSSQPQVHHKPHLTYRASESGRRHRSKGVRPNVAWPRCAPLAKAG